MARKTDGEKVDELVVTAATLVERVDNVREELRELEESSRRWCLLVPPIVAALLSAALMAIVNVVLRYYVEEVMIRNSHTCLP